VSWCCWKAVKGRIIEDGSHGQLLALGGHYAQLWAMQAGGFLPEFAPDVAAVAAL
jgi:ATP-binding cassette, subfamily B, bacterial